MKATTAALLALVLLAGCRNEAARAPAFSDDSPLDQAASEANLIDDPRSTPAVGLYQHDGAAGTDGLCLSPQGEGDSDSLYFGLVMHFGPTLICEGAGTAQHDGDTVRLSFADADCTIDVAYDGRSLRMPGSVPAGCAAVCGPRASMSGGSFERVGWDAADSQRLMSRRDRLANQPARALCRH